MMNQALPGMVAGFVVNVCMNAMVGLVTWPVLADPILIRHQQLRCDTLDIDQAM